MARTHENPACALSGTKYCELLNMVDCNNCTVAEIGDLEYIKNTIDVTASMLPKEGLSSLFTTDECVLCVEKPRGKRVCYAITDLGNPEPKHTTRNTLGLKVTALAGSLVPVQASCCANCRKRILMVEYLPVLSGVLLAALGLLLIAIRPIHDMLAVNGLITPFLVFAVFALGGIVLCRTLRVRLSRRYSYFTRLNVFDIPLLQELPQYGWFEINGGYGKKGVSHYMFSSKTLSQGLFTGTAAQENE